MVAGVADAAEGSGAAGAGKLLVPVDEAGVQARVDELVMLGDVAEQTGSKAIAGLIGDGHRVSKGVALDDFEQRTKDLFIREGIDMGAINNGGGDKAGVGRAGLSRQQCLATSGDQLGLGLHHGWNKAGGRKRTQ